MASTSPAAVAPAATPFSMRAILAPLVAIIVGIFMVVLDTTAVNVAVPGLVRQFHDTIPTLQWTITGYALAQAAVIPLAGWLSDRFGAKRLFLTSLVLFTLGSVLCSTAQSSGMLIAFRVLQGMGGGFVLPVAMAYIYRLSPPEKVGAIMGMMGIPILLAPAIGPVLAGWLVQFASWRWIFLLNLPVGVIGVTLGLRGLPATARQAAGRLDLPGTVLGPLAFVALSYGITEGSSSWTADKTLGGIIVGAVALVLFVLAELRSEAPLLELRVFKSIDFSLAMLVQWVGQFALFGALFLVPLFLQQVRGYGAFDTGLILLPQAIAAAVFMPIGGMLFDRIGARPLVIGGSVLLAIAAFILARVSISTEGTTLILPLALYGAGMGLMMMPMNTHLINAAPRRLVSRVTSLIGALQQVITSLTIAGMSTILTSRPSYHEASAGLAGLAAHAGHAPVHLPPAIGRLFSASFDDTFTVMAVVAIVGAALGLVLRRRTAAQEAETATIMAAEGPVDLEWELLAG
ncbi:MAG TPA: DHA2 family efflux MFS transporter permease subunit, partial [Chloroflexota bacterium]|nr:DHA2 family efflux MFS transporter permease subunit [Chloroflexota bacterium]